MDNSQPPRNVWINEQGVMEIHYKLGMTLDNFTELNERVFRLSDEMEKRGLPVNILVDATSFRGFDPKIPKMARFVLEDIPFRKMAILNVPTTIAPMFNLISKLIRLKGKEIQHYNDRAQALAWLAK